MVDGGRDAANRNAEIQSFELALAVAGSLAPLLRA